MSKDKDTPSPNNALPGSDGGKDTEKQIEALIAAMNAIQIDPNNPASIETARVLAANLGSNLKGLATRLPAGSAIAAGIGVRINNAITATEARCAEAAAVAQVRATQVRQQFSQPNPTEQEETAPRQELHGFDIQSLSILLGSEEKAEEFAEKHESLKEAATLLANPAALNAAEKGQVLSQLADDEGNEQFMASVELLVTKQKTELSADIAGEEPDTPDTTELLETIKPQVHLATAAIVTQEIEDPEKRLEEAGHMFNWLERLGLSAEHCCDFVDQCNQQEQQPGKTNRLDFMKNLMRNVVMDSQEEEKKQEPQKEAQPFADGRKASQAGHIRQVPPQLPASLRGLPAGALQEARGLGGQLETAGVTPQQLTAAEASLNVSPLPTPEHAIPGRQAANNQPDQRSGP